MRITFSKFAFSATFQPRIESGLTLQTVSGTFEPYIVAGTTFKTTSVTFRAHIVAETTKLPISGSELVKITILVS